VAPRPHRHRRSRRLLRHQCAFSLCVVTSSSPSRTRSDPFLSFFSFSAALHRARPRPNDQGLRHHQHQLGRRHRHRARRVRARQAVALVRLHERGLRQRDGLEEPRICVPARPHSGGLYFLWHRGERTLVRGGSRRGPCVPSQPPSRALLRCSPDAALTCAACRSCAHRGARRDRSRRRRRLRVDPRPPLLHPGRLDRDGVARSSAPNLSGAFFPTPSTRSDTAA